MANKFYGTGRRKKSVARVYLEPGKGTITINKRPIDEYFGLETLKVEIGTGSVICMANDLLPVDEKNWCVPAWLI